jgi:DNA-binding NarL/FixJ family response regulator
MSKIKIVLIEDDDLICLGLRTALTQEAEIIWLGEAHSGQEGLTLLQSVQPDIAIIDLGLPDMDGI